jgi:hypothetical protein
MNLTLGQLNRIDRLAAEWSFLWDKRRSLWIAAEDCLDGEQIERLTWTFYWTGSSYWTGWSTPRRAYGLLNWV